MGMSIDEAIGLLERGSQYNYYDSAEDFCKAYDMAIDTMRKYQLFQVDYENRLKADMVAMLTEILLEIEELKSYESADGQDLAMLADIGILFQQKINVLRGN